MSENRTSLSANGDVGSLRRRITTPPAPHIRGGKLDFIDRTCQASCCVLYVYYISMTAIPSEGPAALFVKLLGQVIGHVGVILQRRGSGRSVVNVREADFWPGITSG